MHDTAEDDRDTEMLFYLMPDAVDVLHVEGVARHANHVRLMAPDSSGQMPLPSPVWNVMSRIDALWTFAH